MNDLDATRTDGRARSAHEERRHAWLQASIEVTRSLLSAGGDDPLAAVARAVNSIADADLTFVVLPAEGGERLRVEMAVGEGTEDLVGWVFDVEGSINGEVIRTGLPLLAPDIRLRTSGAQAQDAPPVALRLGPMMAVPLIGDQGARGALSIARHSGGAPFDHDELEMATSFANHAAIALELADARAYQERMTLLEDRHRIANELHDHVLQRLFAAGMTMQAMSASVGAPYAERLEELISDTDETIGRIRAVIHDLNDLRSL